MAIRFLAIRSIARPERVAKERILRRVAALNDILFLKLVSFDGQVIREEPKAAPFLASSLIWQDASGILGWRYILVIGLSWLSSFIFGKAIQNPDRKKLLLICGTVVGLIPLLLAIRLF